MGVGILSTAQKSGKLKPEHSHIAPESMAKLNAIGYELASVKEITAMTDVTGFGLLGHLTEMCEGSNLSALIEFDKIPRFAEADAYIAENCIPGGTHRNWESYGSNVKLRSPEQKLILCDPQTSGGLLIAVEESALLQVTQLLENNNLNTQVFGRLIKRQETLIQVI